MITLIAAASTNNVIGNNGKLPWHLSNDFKMFKKSTVGKPIIMGRKTFESLPGVLPNRVHYVITRQTNLVHPNKNVIFVNSLNDALYLTDATGFADKHVYIIGGGEIYQQALKYATSIVLTRVNIECEGDTYFPEIPEEFHKIFHADNDENDYTYSFEVYQKL